MGGKCRCWYAPRDHRWLGRSCLRSSAPFLVTPLFIGLSEYRGCQCLGGGIVLVAFQDAASFGFHFRASLFTRRGLRHGRRRQLFLDCRGARATKGFGCQGRDLRRGLFFVFGHEKGTRVNLIFGRSTLVRNLESRVDTLLWLTINALPAATSSGIGWRIPAFCRQTSCM